MIPHILSISSSLSYFVSYLAFENTPATEKKSRGCREEREGRSIGFVQLSRNLRCTATESCLSVEVSLKPLSTLVLMQ